MIYVYGDTHGNFNKLKRLSDLVLSPEDIVIQLGDFGFHKDCMKDWDTHFPNGFPCTLYVIDGNHEDFKYLYSFPIDASTGLRPIKKNLYHVPRGTVMEIEGKVFAFMGGGESIDMMNRTLDVSWWTEERITPEDVQNLYNNVAIRNSKIDYLITHVPNKTFMMNNFPPIILSDWKLPEDWRDISIDMVEQIYDELMPGNHYFGHMHDRVMDGNQQCVDIDEMVPLYF